METAAHQSAPVAKSGAASLSTWMVGLAVSILTVTAFIMLSLGLLLGLGVFLGLPTIVNEVLLVPIIATAVWIAIWVCFRVVDVEKRLARGAGTPSSVMHLLKPWVTTDQQ